MKHDINDLALFGGPPAFPQNRRVGRPNSGDRERFLERMNRVFDSEWLSNMGPLMYEFEARIAELAGVRHCISLCNATVGLQMLVGDLATDSTSGDGVVPGAVPGAVPEVIVPALTFPATAHAVKWRGLRPVFCDVDPVTGLIDPDHAESLITPQTRAIIGVHLWGQACDMDRLEKIAESNRLRLFFDGAHALGCTYGDKPIGGFGDAEVFSFHATKLVHTFEGGAIVTDDDALAERMRAARNFGFGEDGTMESVGTNGKMSEAAAAMGLTSLDALDDTIADNRASHVEYQRALAGIPGVTAQEFHRRHRNNYHYMMVTVAEETAGLHRDTLLDVLLAENIVARPYFSKALHQMKPYVDMSATPPVRLPHSEALCEQLLALPTGPVVTADDIGVIADVIRAAVAHGPEVAARRRAGAVGSVAE